MLKCKSTTTKTDLFEEIISIFAMWQEARFEIGCVYTVVCEGVSGYRGKGTPGRGDRERRKEERPLDLDHSTHPISKCGHCRNENTCTNTFFKRVGFD